MTLASGTPEDAGSLADRVAGTAAAVPGVAGLHSGSFGEVATYLVGRQVQGVRVHEDGTEVHVVVTMGHPLLEVAEAVRAAVEPLVTSRVDVVVEDVVPAGS